jgi:hypothetical protein
MTHDQLVKVFPMAVPSTFPRTASLCAGYALALADVERRGGKPSETSLEAAREAGVVTASRTRNFFARLFGRGKDSDESSEDTTATTPDTATKDTRAPVAVASVTPPKPKAVAVETIVPLPTARPASTVVASAETKTIVGRRGRSQTGQPFLCDGIAWQQPVRQPRLLARRDPERPGCAGRR